MGVGLKAAVRHELKGRTHQALLYSGGMVSSALLSVTPTSAIPITVEMDQEADDLARSNAAAAILGRTRELEAPTRPVTSLVETLAAASGEPLADPSALTQLAICEAAAGHRGRRTHGSRRGHPVGRMRSQHATLAACARVVS